MHRDEAIYARSDARGVTLTDEEVRALQWLLNQAPEPEAEWCGLQRTVRALASRLGPPSTTPSP